MVLDGMMSFCADYRIIQEVGVNSLHKIAGVLSNGVLPPSMSSLSAWTAQLSTLPLTQRFTGDLILSPSNVDAACTRLLFCSKIS
jgi:hypothetical protein